MSFSDEFTSDGENDGSISLQEALDAVWSAYVANGNVMPSTVVVDHDHNGISVTITIELASAIH